MNKIKKFARVMIIIVCIIGGIFLILYNISNNSNFFQASCTTIITILIAIILSYYLSERKTDTRRKKEKIDDLLYKIQDTVLDEQFLEIKDTDLIDQRSIVNKIKYISDSNIEDIKEEINRLDNEFSEFRRFYGDHYKDLKYMNLPQTRLELKNYITKIDDICDKIHMKLI